MPQSVQKNPADAHLQEYLKRQEANRLRRAVFDQADPSAFTALLDQLRQAEAELSDAESRRAAIQEQIPDPTSVLFAVQTAPERLLGPETTGLEVTAHLRMAQLPTAICHLFSAEDDPLLTFRVRNAGRQGTRRLRLTSFIDGFSARAVDTVELAAEKEVTVPQLPTLFPERRRTVTELTRATLNVLVEDLDGKVETHSTVPLWLLAHTTAPLAVRDPKTSAWQDMTPYLGAFVTPNAPDVISFLRTVAEHHPDQALCGYQGDETAIEPQVRAVFEALKAASKIAYVNSVVAFSPEDGSVNQRVRLPRESLKNRQANCIDGTVLFASLLEAISLSPAIVVVPGHAFVAWETWEESDDWRFLETTMIHAYSFEQARASAERTAAFYKSLAASQGKPHLFRFWPLRNLRSHHRIMPME